MTNIEVAKIMVSGMKCLLSREQIHELADILICRKFKKDRKSTRLNSSHSGESRMPSSA